MLVDLPPLIIMTVTACAIHASLLAYYKKFFVTTKTWKFRIFHSIEIGLVVLWMLFIYGQFAPPTLSNWQIILVVLGTLAVIDGLLFVFFKKVRQLFDIYHFVAIYGVTALTVFLYYSLA